MGVKGFIHSVETFGAVDGPGIRYVVFFQGCPLRCLYCHNPDSREFNSGKETDSEDIVKDILEYKNFIRKGGVTLSGGEPLAQADFAADILRLCKKSGIHTAVDTSGAIPPEKAGKVLDFTDLVLLDIKATDIITAEKLTGSGISGALKILDFCDERKIDVWIRHVIVPGWTMNKKSIEELAFLIRKHSCVKKTELIPFHKMGEYKWKALGMDYALSDTPTPTPEEMRELREILHKSLEK